MADAVDIEVVHWSNPGRRYVVHLTNKSDGTGETNVTKIDVSTLTNAFGNTATKLTVDRIEYSVWGIDYVELKFDADTDDVLALLKGQGVIDWSLEGGYTDPQSTGATGDLLLTTSGATSGGGYDITLWTRPKA